MKVFISQPMRNKTDEEILKVRADIKRKLERTYDENVEIIDSFFQEAPHEAKPLWYLGESLKLMSDADLVVFTSDWRSARGCRIERQCAIDYGLKMMLMN